MAKVRNQNQNRQPFNDTFVELEKLIAMKEVAEEENLVALKSLIETAEKVLASDYIVTLQKQVS